jgi:hypothetical protein
LFDGFGMKIGGKIESERERERENQLREMENPTSLGTSVKMEGVEGTGKVKDRDAKRRPEKKVDVNITDNELIH